MAHKKRIIGTTAMKVWDELVGEVAQINKNKTTLQNVDDFVRHRLATLQGVATAEASLPMVYIFTRAFGIGIGEASEIIHLPGYSHLTIADAIERVRESRKNFTNENT